MDYTMEVASVKDKKQLKLIINPTNNLEKEFFNSLFVPGNAIVETVPNSDEVVITVKEKGIPTTIDEIKI